ncbi:hypothetical protein CW751_02470 [Brumimicrobium salinarum]|uniref:Uncharacterized protein n=2 Tax=Brumimicrobium salinarum TaxID=2058658 RepID=A0A2I0R6M0_9FLAO|nr:hypothetical protein CW751_02470 [Brumimicrobium salinarum]
MLSCGEEQAKTNDDLKVEYPEELNELDNFEALSLKPYNINALIYVPDATANIGASTAPEIIHEPNDYKWEIKVGQNFHMTIEDWGDENVLKDHLDELENQSVYAIEFLEKEDGFAYYKASLNVKGQEDNNSVGVDHVTYHVVAQHSIEGVNYLFKTNKDGHQKPITDLMAKSVKSVQPISEPS